MAISKQGKDRYPGLNSFLPEQQPLFFGRGREKEELLQLIRLEQVVVLFSKSGLGKSSLLNAGIIPSLHTQGFQPISVRFQQEKTAPIDQATSKSPIDVLINSLHTEFRAACTQQKLAEQKLEILYDRNNPRLWEAVKSCPFPGGHVPIFVFDQFEEFFSYPVADQQVFASQLVELLHDQAPARVINWLLDLEKRTPEAVAWSSQPPIKCVFAIRADRLSDMDSLKAYFPLILRNRYELGPLQEEAARDAICLPAQLTQEAGPFITPAFTYDPLVLDTILKTLCNENSEVEGAQLQIVCQFVEGCQKDEFCAVVDQSVLTGEREINRILDKFYRTQLNGIGNESAIVVASNILENELIEGGRRVALSDPKMIRLLGNLDNTHKRELIQQLQDARLIRSDVTHLGTTYELSHDTLIEPVEKARKIREAWKKRRNDREESSRELKQERAQQALLLQQEIDAKEAAIQTERAKDVELRKVQRLQKRYEFVIRLFTLASILAVIFLSYGLANLVAKGRLSQYLFEAVALPNYNQGHHAVAFRLWEEKAKLSKGFFQWYQTDLATSSTRTFAPYAGREVLMDKSQQYVVARYDDGISDGIAEVFQRRGNRKDTVLFKIPASAIKLTGMSLAIFQPDSTGYTFRILNLRTLKNSSEAIHVPSTQAVTLSTGGSYAVFLDAKRQPHLQLLTGQHVKELPFFNEQLVKDQAKLSPSDTKITFDAQDHFVLIQENAETTSDQQRLWVFDLQKKRYVGRIDKVEKYQLCTEANLLAGVTRSGQIKLMDLQAVDNHTRILGSLTYPFKYISRLMFAPDNKSLVIIPAVSKSPLQFQIDVVDLKPDHQQAKLLVSGVDDHWVSESADQLFYSVFSQPGLLFSYQPSGKCLASFPTSLRPVLVGKNHMVMKQGNSLSIHKVDPTSLLPAFQSVASPHIKSNIKSNIRFYSTNHVSDTHLLVLYTNRIEIVDLQNGTKNNIHSSNAQLGKLSLTGNLLRAELGKTSQDVNLSSRQYWAFFIDYPKNDLDSLRQYVYPILTQGQRREFGLPK
ncbi:nSTAND1 domain-containing NTPase [Fibrella forsythiae]|uniref:Novel STAND NTPase 1 domain-containing protein n=1 Tax=Fibrella forsythiae TaxID=2817061 RepID=A0ABS3JMI8_9BACT|nr:hypothetical protein [Fibrella forsythiae]MBO0950611.1 hypothetical protein [Fibrella forsythiae]